MSYTLRHRHVTIDNPVRILREGAIATISIAVSGTFVLRFPGRLDIGHRAGFQVSMFVEDVGVNTEPDPDGKPKGRWQSQPRTVPLELSLFDPEGLPWEGTEVTLADLRRFRDPRGVTPTPWRYELRGQAGPIEEEEGQLRVVPGRLRLVIGSVETVQPVSAPRLVGDRVEAADRRRFDFDLFRVGRFEARAVPEPLGASSRRSLRLLDPDGRVVAQGTNQLVHPVGLDTLALSRDAQGKPRRWALEVDAEGAGGPGGVLGGGVLGGDTGGVLEPLRPARAVRRPPIDIGEGGPVIGPGGGGGGGGGGGVEPRSSLVEASVFETARLHVRTLQDRIDRLLGPGGNKLEVFAENDGGDAVVRLRIHDAETAETLDLHHVLDDVLGSVTQEAGAQADDLQAGPLYTLVRESRSLGKGFKLSVAGLRVDSIAVAVGASTKIRPAVPALRIELAVSGQARAEFRGITVASAKVRGGRLRLEAGLRLEQGRFAPATWLEPDFLDLDVSIPVALLPAIGLSAVAAAEYLEDKVNDRLPRALERAVAQALGRAPHAAAIVLGDDFTYRSLRLDGDDILFEYVAPLEPDPRPRIDQDYVAIAGRSATQLGPHAWRLVPPTLGDTWAVPNLAAKIDHVVVVMMENRSFDHVLGHRSLSSDPAAAATDGLSPALLAFLAGQGFPVEALQSNPRIPENALHLRTAFPKAVGHELADVTQQLARQLTTPEGRAILSPQGFVDNFRGKLPKGAPADDAAIRPTDVLGYYTGAELPFTDFLLREFGWCERFFCSHPGPTLPNRMISLTGDLQHDRTGAPLLDNNNGDDFYLSRATTVFDLLTRFGVTWRVYESFPSVAMLRMFARYATDETNIVDRSRLRQDVLADNLPQFTCVEPAMHHFPQNDDHPVADMYRGQLFLRQVYEDLRANARTWERTLLIVTYDEHGGFYDHVVPPLAEARSLLPVFTQDGTPPPLRGPTPPPTSITVPYGVRVPTLVVSPWVPPGATGQHAVLDHTSIVKTVLARFCPRRPFLSDRVHAARSFDGWLTADAPRASVEAPGLAPLDPPSSSRGRARGRPRIATPPLSRAEMRRGNVDFHELTGRLARMLGR